MRLFPLILLAALGLACDKTIKEVRVPAPTHPAGDQVALVERAR